MTKTLAFYPTNLITNALAYSPPKIRFMALESILTVMGFLLKPKSVLKIQLLDIFDFKGLTRWTVLRVTRLGELLPFGLLFKGLGDFFR